MESFDPSTVPISSTDLLIAGHLFELGCESAVSMFTEEIVMSAYDDEQFDAGAAV
jgi:hypothetical protein